MDLPILYSFRRCPYAMRARLALQVAGSKCELREVVLRDKPKAMLDCSPKGTVPVLLFSDGRVIEESLEIALWALGCSDPQGWLAPSEGSQEEMLCEIERAEDAFKFHLDRYKYASRHDGADEVEHRDCAATFLEALERRLTRSAWLFGSKLSLGDVALAPFVRQFAHVDREWFDAQPWPSLVSWLDDFLASPIFLSAMKKYPQWHEGDAITCFPDSDEQTWERRAT